MMIRPERVFFLFKNFLRKEPHESKVHASEYDRGDSQLLSGRGYNLYIAFSVYINSLLSDYSNHHHHASKSA